MELDTVLACRSTWVFSGLLVSTVRHVVVLQRNHGGQGGLWCSGGVESPWRSELTGVEVWLDSGDGVVRGRGNKPGEVPGAQAKRLRGLLVVEARRSGMFTVAR